MTNKINFEIDLDAEIRTPQDGRTYERKWIVSRTRELPQCTYESEFGFFLGLRFKDIKLFIASLNNLN